MSLYSLQPWRYADAGNYNYGASANREGVFVPATHQKFISDNADFYNVLFAKLCARLARVDLSSSRNAYMLFRAVKVFSR